MPIFMKYGKINGEAKAAGHEGWIELESAQLGTSRNATATGSVSRESRAPTLNEIVVTKKHDSSSTHLAREALHGEGVEVIIDFMPNKARKPGEPPRAYLSMKLSDCMISSYSISGHGGTGGGPMESISLNCTSITHTTNREFDLIEFLRAFGLPIP